MGQAARRESGIALQMRPAHGPGRRQGEFRWALPHKLAALSGEEAALLGLGRIDPLERPPEKRLLALLGAEFCIATGLLPWRRCGDAVIVLSARPGQIGRHMGTLNRALGPVRMAHAPEADIRAAIMAVAGRHLVGEAESRVATEESCRSVGRAATSARARGVLAFAVLALIGAVLMRPGFVLAGLTLWAVFWMVLGLGLKLMAFRAARRAPPPVEGWPRPDPLPVISLLVPLFQEAEVAARLLPRLTAIDYPREALDLCLIVEDDDATTQAALAALALPAWAQVIEVPRGTLRTKPRALNFALPFARGSILGIYDAEDLPHPRQLFDVATQFARSPAEVACLQGRLDYYNADANWLARCFTLEYAAWFRALLPGLARLGLVVPLGGTTLFLRRTALDAVGGWDAHNVTEDADLGLRLARHGLRTEVIHIVTEEEANARLWPWVRQRSRWLKGYAMTWAVHMRRPRLLLRDLGWRRFMGVQVLFLGALTQLALAPVIWLCWLPLLGLPHPLAGILPPVMLWTIGAVFLVSTLAEIVVHAWAVRAAGKARLMRWIPALILYYPLATLACWRGLLQILSRPYFWDKTAHGVFAPEREVMAPPAPGLHPVSDG
jgi:cellulose synthase/poly-beta-1,6-N-acetylglucosamine synthase-like glycosyltransferase